MNPLQSILDRARPEVERPAAATSEPLAALPVVAVPCPAPPSSGFTVLAVIPPPLADGDTGTAGPIIFAPGLSIQEQQRIRWESAWACPGRGWSDLAKKGGA